MNILQKQFALVAFIYLASNFLSFAQSGLSEINENLKTVEGSKTTFRQDLKSMEDGMVLYSLIEQDDKGLEKETQYNFSFADIDENTVRAITKKDLINIQLLVEGKQKFIQVVENGGDKISYANELSLMALNAENAGNLVNTIKSWIPEAKQLEERRLSLTGLRHHLDWLLQNIADIELPKKQIIQKIELGKAIGNVKLDQTINAKSKTKNELKELNLATLNPNSVRYRINGDEFLVQVETRRGIKSIRYFEDGTQKNFDDDFGIYAKSITNGKDIYKVLKEVIELASKEFDRSQPTFNSAKTALDYLNSVITEVSTAEESILQNLTISDNVATLRRTESKPDATKEFLYEFNFGDINENNIDYDGQKDRLYALLPTKKSVKFIKNTENGEIQNFEDEIKLYFNTIEETIIGTNALKSLARLFEEKIESKKYGQYSVESGVNQIKNLLKKVKIGDDTYDVFIEIAEKESNTLKLTSNYSSDKKSIETIQEFRLEDINPRNCAITVTGKHVMVELNSLHLEKIVKTYVDGQIKPYQSKVVIEVVGIEEAREIVEIFKHLSDI